MEINVDTGYMELEEALASLYKTVEPLYAMVDGIAKLMDKTGRMYFRLPAYKSTDLKSHYFIFDRTNGEYVFKECI